jgi:hypothetical protein
MGKAEGVISGTAGRIIANYNNNLISSRISLISRKGMRVPWEKELMYNFSCKTLIDKNLESAVSYVEEKCKELKENNFDKHDFIYETVVHENLDEYSDRTYRTERLQALLRLNQKKPIEKGEKVRLGYGIKNKEADVFFEDEFLSSEIEIDREHYKSKFFGPRNEEKRELTKGSVSDLVYSVFFSIHRSQQAAREQALYRLFEGSPIEGYKSLLGFNNTKQERLF